MSAVKREPINPPGTEAIYEAYHFSQATRAGNTVWLSGQVGITPDMQPGKDEYLRAPYPSWTAVGVTQLAMPDLKVEVRVVAAIGSGTEYSQL